MNGKDKSINTYGQRISETPPEGRDGFTPTRNPSDSFWSVWTDIVFVHMCI